MLALGLCSLRAGAAALDQKAIDDLAGRVAKGDAAAAAALRTEAESGNALAELSLGRILAFGRGLAKNQAEALKWFRRSAAQGNVRAQSNVGTMLYNGFGVPADRKEGIKLWRRAADKGLDVAQLNLAAAYFSGKGVTQDPAQGVAWLRKAASQGNVQAKYRLGVAYEGGVGVAKNLDEAIRLYKESADAGFARAQWRLALHYKLGRGVAKDELKACEVVGLSAAQDDPAALLLRADCYYRGIGVRKDLVEMERLVRRSAKLGYRPAQRIVEMKILPSQVAAANAELKEQLLAVLLGSGREEPKRTARTPSGTKPTTQEDLNSAFLAAAREGDLAEVSRLLDKGANPRAKMPDGETALHLIAAQTIRRGYEPCFKIAMDALLNAGLDPAIKDNQGRTAYDVAVSSGNTFVAERLKTEVQRRREANGQTR